MTQVLIGHTNPRMRWTATRMYIVAAEITLGHIADEGDFKLEMLSDGIDHDTAKNFRNRRCHNDTASILSQTRTRTSARATTTCVTRLDGKALRRRRGNVVERIAAHFCEAGGRRRVTVRRRVNGHAWYQLCGDSHNLSRILRSYWEPVKTPYLSPRDVPF